MKLGVCVPNFGGFASPSSVKAAAELSEEHGFDSIWATDHLAVPLEQKMPYGTTYEALSTLAYLAATTSRIRVGSSAIIIPLRNPVVVAKQAATIDRFSNGRLILGIGFGWLEAEFRYLKADFKHRYSAVQAGVRLMRAMWLEDPINYSDSTYSIIDCLADPKPIQKPIPIYIAGNSKKAIKIAAEVGDGWHPVGLSPEEVAEGVEVIRSIRSGGFEVALRSPVNLGGRAEYRGASGRAMYTIQGSDREVMDAIQHFKDSGVTHLVMTIVADGIEDYLTALRVLGRSVLPSFRA